MSVPGAAELGKLPTAALGASKRLLLESSSAELDREARSVTALVATEATRAAVRAFASRPRR